jgi:hypothetical protein
MEDRAVKTSSGGGVDWCAGDGDDRRATGGEEDGAISEARCWLGGAGHRYALTRHRGGSIEPAEFEGPSLDSV